MRVLEGVLAQALGQVADVTLLARRRRQHHGARLLVHALLQRRNRNDLNALVFVAVVVLHALLDVARLHLGGDAAEVP